MILYHVTKYKLGKSFKASGRICCAPTLSQCILGLQDLIHFKKSWRKHRGQLYVYKCKATQFYDGFEFDSHIIDEKLVIEGTKFKLVGTLDKEFVNYLHHTFTYPMLEAPTLLENQQLTKYMRLLLKMIKVALKREIRTLEYDWKL